MKSCIQHLELFLELLPVPTAYIGTSCCLFSGFSISSSSLLGERGFLEGFQEREKGVSWSLHVGSSFIHDVGGYECASWKLVRL